MRRSYAYAAAVVGAWVAVAPLVLGWRLTATVMASSILPGALVALAAGYCGATVISSGDGETQARLAVSLTSSTLLLAVWQLLCPFLLGIPLEGDTCYGLFLPAAAILCLSLANGYLGWRDDT